MSSQIKSLVDEAPLGQIVSARFGYNGKPRIVDNLTYEESSDCILGYEMREQGRFSYQVKRFSVEKIEGFELIDPPHRSGPSMGRP